MMCVPTNYLHAQTLNLNFVSLRKMLAQFLTFLQFVNVCKALILIEGGRRC